MRNAQCLLARALAVVIATTALVLAPAVAPRADAQSCAGSVGPGLAPPARVPSGIPGYHAHWYGQSGYMALCPGESSTATVAYYNSGTLGWIAGRMGHAAYLGTWGPEPGQDRASALGGNGFDGSPNTGWPESDRLAVQPSPWVGPGQIAWFQFTVRAPSTPGQYRLYMRPLIEGATWMEDFGAYMVVTVLNPDGSLPPPPPPPPAVATRTGYSYVSVPTPRGTFGVHLIKERLSDVAVRTVTATLADCTSDCPVKPLDRYVAEYGAYAGMNGTYLCPPDYAWCAGKVNSYDYAVYHSYHGRWVNSAHLASPTNALATFVGGTPRFYRRVRSYDRGAVTAGISNFPLLLAAGNVVDSEAEQTPAQQARGTKGSIGTDGTHVFLALVTNASVTDSAYVLRAIGVRDAMNLDGGGTAAMHIGGSYRVGPGRLLPNAVLLTRR